MGKCVSCGVETRNKLCQNCFMEQLRAIEKREQARKEINFELEKERKKFLYGD